MARPQAAIVGVAESDLGHTPDKTVLQLQHQAARAALEDAGLGFGDVDALFCAGGWAWVLRGPSGTRGGGHRGRSVRGRADYLW
jgi:hypothetical protein